MGTVEMKTPAMGMKLQMKTNSPSRPIPGIWRIHMPNVVRAVLAIAICACIDRPVVFSKLFNRLHLHLYCYSCTHSFNCCSRVHSFAAPSFSQLSRAFKLTHPYTPSTTLHNLICFAVHSVISLFMRLILPSFLRMFNHSPIHPCNHTSIKASLGGRGPDPNCDPTCMCLAHTTLLYHLTLLRGLWSQCQNLFSSGFYRHAVCIT